MKNTITLLILLLLSTSAKSQYELLTDSKLLFIKFSNEVNGYNVKVIWKPNHNYFEHIVGPAIIEFYKTNDSTSFSLTENNFCILKRKLPIIYSEDSSKIISIGGNNYDTITLYYDKESTESIEGSFGTTEEPFFFQDIDFDNKKELLITEFGQAQRGAATFKSYKVDEDESNDFGNLMNEKPINLLDEMSVIDYVNKQIKIFFSEGACLNGQDIYQLKSHKESSFSWKEFILEAEVREERDSKLDKCYLLKYKVINHNTKQLISKEEVK